MEFFISLIFTGILASMLVVSLCLLCATPFYCLFGLIEPTAVKQESRKMVFRVSVLMALFSSLVALVTYLVLI
jgi:hypothetical protein